MRTSKHNNDVQISVDLNLPNIESESGCELICNSMQNDTPCDLVRKLEQAREQAQISCQNTCEQCENIVTFLLDIDSSCNIYVPATITIYNKKSVCKIIAGSKTSQTIMFTDNIDNISKLPITSSTKINIAFDTYAYCINGKMTCLDDVLVITTENGIGFGNVDMYVDIETPGDIIFTSQISKKFTTVFQPTINDGVKTIMNMGTIMDPSELLNLKAVFTDKYAFYCKIFTNPAPFRLINTYLRPGDRVKLLQPNNLLTDTVLEPITADLPTVFDINRKILDIAVGKNCISLLLNNKCNTNVIAIGNNCYGQLGLNSFISTPCWKSVKKGYFANQECQDNCVVRLFAGPTSTFYLTQNWSIYASGYQPYLSHNSSSRPTIVKEIKRVWKTKKLIVSKNNLIALSADGFVFGIGNNEFGNLGSNEMILSNFKEIKYYCDD